MKRFKSESYHKRKVDKVIPEINTFTVDGLYMSNALGTGIMLAHQLDINHDTLVTVTVTVKEKK